MASPPTAQFFKAYSMQKQTVSDQKMDDGKAWECDYNKAYLYVVSEGHGS